MNASVKQAALPPAGSDTESAAGVLIVNADDWGRNERTTDRILDCALRGSVSSVSAMVFMEDSERAAATAREKGIDAGLHLNFTTKLSAPGTPRRLFEHQQRLMQYLSGRRFAQVIFHPALADSFRYVVMAQRDEFARLYGAEPQRLDGHHHMHLCANVLFGRLLPTGTTVRRSFSFRPGEKPYANRLYRRFIDRMLAKRHGLTDFFFSLAPLGLDRRLERIFSLSREFAVEVETHPVNDDEYRYLSTDTFGRAAERVVAFRSAAVVWAGIRARGAHAFGPFSG